MIPVNRPQLGPRAEELVLQCLREGWISSDGPWIQRFEAEMSRMVGVKYAIAVANGSAALDIAVQAAGIGPGDEVIMPSLTIISCAASVVRAGATPIPVDVDPVTWTLSPDAAARAITGRTKAIMPVHLYGLPVDLDPILSFARSHGLKVIEDAAEAHGSLYKGKPCGSFGDLATFSFYANKHVTTGEGGMILTSDESIAERCRSLRNLCFGKVRFIHEDLGWNYRLASLQAALGIASLEMLPDAIARKRRLGAQYGELLAGIDGIEVAPATVPYARNDYWVYGVVLREDRRLDAAEVSRRLIELGVATRPFFHPLHLQPVLRRMGFCAQADCPVSERLGKQGLYLPSGIGTTDQEVESAAAAFRKAIA